ncbi:MAG: hypothetical protein IKV11_02120 [Alphaproteobacteria bacterium]|nr:hypothetical protein [Alphaproteobacteria bacterium]
MKIKAQTLGLLWIVVFAVTSIAITSGRQYEKNQKEDLSIEVVTTGTFDCKVTDDTWLETSNGEFLDSRIVGIRLQGDETVYPVRGKVDFQSGDSVFITADGVVLSDYPENQDDVREALYPTKTAYLWVNLICGLFWLAATLLSYFKLRSLS